MHLLAQTAEFVQASDPGFLTTLVADFTREQRFALCVIVVACGTGLLITIACTFAGVWHNIRKRESEIELTRDLLDQGKSAEEIEKILRPAEGFARAAERWSKRC